jgi:hypothetical protein
LHGTFVVSKEERGSPWHRRKGPPKAAAGASIFEGKFTQENGKWDNQLPTASVQTIPTVAQSNLGNILTAAPLKLRLSSYGGHFNVGYIFTLVSNALIN